MPYLPPLSTSVFAVIALAVAAPPAFAADPAKKRCSELIAFYDRWGTTKTPDHSDGARNHNRIAAEFDCARGDYATGIAIMEAQIHNRLRMEVPVDVGEAPMFFPDENTAQAQARALKSR
jgi:hypothetical protein